MDRSIDLAVQLIHCSACRAHERIFIADYALCKKYLDIVNNFFFVNDNRQANILWSNFSIVVDVLKRISPMNNKNVVPNQESQRYKRGSFSTSRLFRALGDRFCFE